MVREVRGWGWGRGGAWRGTLKHKYVLFLDLWASSTGMFTLRKSNKLYIHDLCPFLYICYTLIKIHSDKREGKKSGGGTEKEREWREKQCEGNGAANWSHLVSGCPEQHLPASARAKRAQARLGWEQMAGERCQGSLLPYPFSWGLGCHSASPVTPCPLSLGGWRFQR